MSIKKQILILFAFFLGSSFYAQLDTTSQHVSVNFHSEKKKDFTVFYNREYFNHLKNCDTIVTVERIFKRGKQVDSVQENLKYKYNPKRFENHYYKNGNIKLENTFKYTDSSLIVFQKLYEKNGNLVLFLEIESHPKRGFSSLGSYRLNNFAIYQNGTPHEGYVYIKKVSDDEGIDFSYEIIDSIPVFHIPYLLADKMCPRSNVGNWHNAVYGFYDKGKINTKYLLYRGHVINELIEVPKSTFCWDNFYHYWNYKTYRTSGNTYYRKYFLKRWMNSPDFFYRIHESKDTYVRTLSTKKSIKYIIQEKRYKKFFMGSYLDTANWIEYGFDWNSDTVMIRKFKKGGSWFDSYYVWLKGYDTTYYIVQNGDYEYEYVKSFGRDLGSHYKTTKTYTKDSITLYKEYFVNFPKVVKEEGTLINQKRVGTWKLYNEKGELIREEEY
jgi:hypothetical protein